MTINKTAKKIEDEYFARQEFERKQKKLAEEHKKLAGQMQKEMKELHFMHCPKCGMELIEIEFKAIKVDKCSECGGIYLDDGELDQLMLAKNEGLFKKFIKTFKN